MALIHTLLRYKDEGRIASFEMHGDKKATVQLRNSSAIIVYMSVDYIIGESEVQEAVQPPSAKYIVYNNWDTVGQGAFREAKRLGIEVHKFGAFSYRLDELNGAS